MESPPAGSALSWKLVLSKDWWIHNWKWAVPVAGLVVVLFGPLLVLIIPVAYMALRQARKRSEEMRHVCEVLGFEYEDATVWEPGTRFGSFRHFADSSGSAQGLMTGSLAEHAVTVMEYCYGPKAQHRETLAVFPDGAKGLPDFELAPGLGAWGEKIQAAFGHGDINFPSNEEFSKLYSLRGSDEAGIRRTFDASMLAFFSANPGWSVETSGEAAMILRPNVLCRPPVLPAFLAEALNVLGEIAKRR